MTKFLRSEFLVGVLLLVLLLLLLDPFMYWMPHGTVPVILGLVLVVCALFVGLLWRDRASDEREEQHARIAGRIGYAAGVLVLVIGCTYQTLTNMIDPWLYAALVVMVLGKVLGRVYVEHHG